MAKPKGRAYCDTPHTSCDYDERGICKNCLRPKGWRTSQDIAFFAYTDSAYSHKNASRLIKDQQGKLIITNKAHTRQLTIENAVHARALIAELEAIIEKRELQ